MTQEELIKENESLNSRLRKATEVYSEQKATIKRLTEERDAAVNKASKAEEQDQLFFSQQAEIEQLKDKISERDKTIKSYSDELSELKCNYVSVGDKLKEIKDILDKVNNKYFVN